MAEFSNNQLDAIERTVGKWPPEKMVRRACEELMELGLSLSQWHRGKADIEEVLSEMADVHIVLRHLEFKFGDYQQHLDRKVVKGNGT